MKVGIAGVGGIGSNVAWNLIRAGITEFILADFDRVEPSNLNRQFYFHDQIGQSKVHMAALNFRRINPELVLEAHEVRLDDGNLPSVFADCDVIVEGFDRAEMKACLLESFADAGKLVVSACGVAGRELAGVRVRRLGPCICVGDFQSDVAAEPLHCPKIQLVAALMADIIMKRGETHELCLARA